MPGPVNYKGIPVNPWIDLEARNTEGRFPAYMPSIEYRVHQGNYFSTSHIFETVTGGSSVYGLLRTNSVELHAILTCSAGADAFAYLYEGADITDTGTESTIFNHNRTSSKSATAQAFTGPTFNSKGTAISPGEFLPGGTRRFNSVGSASPAVREEWILKPNTDYLFEVVNKGSGDEPICITTTFYEV